MKHQSECRVFSPKIEHTHDIARYWSSTQYSMLTNTYLLPRVSTNHLWYNQLWRWSNHLQTMMIFRRLVFICTLFVFHHLCKIFRAYLKVVYVVVFFLNFQNMIVFEQRMNIIGTIRMSNFWRDLCALILR